MTYNNKLMSHKKTARKSTGFMKHPRVVVGGTQHHSAKSFKHKGLTDSEKMQLYRDMGIVWVAPTRGSVYTNVVVSWMSLQWPQNHIRSPLIVSEGIEVAEAYNGLVDLAISKKKLLQGFNDEAATLFAKAPFILTTEEDNVLPPDAVVKLLTAIHQCPDCKGPIEPTTWKCKKGHSGYDAVSGLYFIKTDPPIPMAFGDPKKKPVKFNPVSVQDSVKHGRVLEVNGIAMGCALWRKELFKKVSRPWFKTTPNWTQDLYFCLNAKKQAKARFGVHCGVRVGHFNPNTRQLF